ncbi:MAG: hypothetical protein KDD70_12170 [Bdellovibrionales bacterium]|nr:hypothetical protein [Bdellovibrionales bacterium]
MRRVLLVLLLCALTPFSALAQRFDPIPVPGFSQSTRINHPTFFTDQEFDRFVKKAGELGIELEVDSEFTRFTTKQLCDEELWEDLLDIARREILESGAVESGIPEFLLNLSLGAIELLGYDLIDFIMDDLNRGLEEVLRQECEAFSHWTVLSDQTVIADQCVYHGLGDDAPEDSGDFPGLCEYLGFEAWIIREASDIPEGNVYIDIFWTIPHCECTRTIYPGFDQSWMEGVQQDPTQSTPELERPF